MRDPRLPGVETVEREKESEGAMKPEFYNIDCIAFTNPRKVRTWGIFYKTIVDYEIITKEDGRTFYYIGNDGRKYQPKNKKGKTDFCTTPPFLWIIKWFVPCRFCYAGTMHDAGYADHALVINEILTAVTRVFMDNLLDEMIENEPDAGTPAEAWTYRKGVRLFGGWFWDREEDKHEEPPVQKIDMTRFPVALA